MDYITKSGLAIKSFLVANNISKEVQLPMVRDDWWAIRFINNPSEEVQLMAVRASYPAIQYIVDPSEELQLEAVKQNGMLSTI